MQLGEANARASRDASQLGLTLREDLQTGVRRRDLHEKRSAALRAVDVAATTATTTLPLGLSLPVHGHFGRFHVHGCMYVCMYARMNEMNEMNE